MKQVTPGKRIVIFITSYNRREITLRHLRVLTKEIDSSLHKFDIFLMDDASPDGTGAAVKEEFIGVKVIYGNGNLYWAGGVRLILETLGSKLKEYDAILLVNDDIILNPGALDLLVNYGLANNAIVGGTVISLDGQIESSGSLLGKFCKPKPRILIANGHWQKCELLPGHIMLIPMKVYDELSGFDQELPYRFLDLEFTHRASKSGISLFLAPTIVATTDDVHDYYKETSSMRGSLLELIRNILLDPKGPYWKESARYLRSISPVLWWLWLPLFYRAFFVAVFRSYLEKLAIFRKI